MRAERKGRNFILYEKEQSDRVQEAIERLARLSAAGLDDGTASSSERPVRCVDAGNLLRQRQPDRG